MIAEYLQSALRRAHYELEDHVFFAEIPEFQGIVAYGSTLEDCRNQLLEILEGWLIVGIRHGHAFPILEGIDINPFIEAA
jgi:predicted RNase H-like HicB family nuclease